MSHLSTAKRAKTISKRYEINRFIANIVIDNTEGDALFFDKKGRKFANQRDVRIEN